ACGLPASTTAATSPTAARGGLRRKPRPLSAATSGLGCGSITATLAGERPRRSQPSSMAPPILPAPARRMVPDRLARGSVFACGFAAELIAALMPVMPGSSGHPRPKSRAGQVRADVSAGSLRLPLGVEHGGIKRSARRLARPHHELESGEIPLAGVERRPQQRLALPPRGFDAAGEHQCVSIHDEPVLGPQIEMSDPHLLVDQRDQLLHLAAATLRHFELEG